MSYYENQFHYGAGKLLEVARGDFNGIWIPEEECILQVTAISLEKTGPVITLSDSKYSSKNVEIEDRIRASFAQKVRLYDLIGTVYILGQ